MEIKTAEFLISSTDVKKCPKEIFPEYAFIGRSNVGKSSLINMLTNNSKLAKISSKPGKTQTINHFLINKAWYLVDLPGYGFAKISKKEKDKWQLFVNEYIKKRKNLYQLFVLIDSRIPPQKIDLEFIEWLGENYIPFAIIMTKTDKLKKGVLDKNVEKLKTELLKTWEELPLFFYTSTVKHTGKTEILEHIDRVNQANPFR